MNEENKKQIYNEAKIMKKLSHPNVISFKDVFRDTKLDYFYIVMEYADDGDLNKKIKLQQNKKSIDKYFSEEIILKYFYQICQGINYIHSQNVIHRDIKSQNIFLMKSGEIKIGDFGIAKALSKTKSNAMTIIGTPYYFSPEIINGDPYNYKTDIWSLGVVLYEMCNLKLPFDSSNIAQLSMKILRGNYDPVPFKYSKEMHHLIKRMLNVDQNKRPDIKEVMQCPLLQNINLNLKNNKNLFKKKKNWSNNNQKSVNINSTVSTFNEKMNEPFLDQKKKGGKSNLFNKKDNKDKSFSPAKFKNRSFIGKAGFSKKNNENSDSSIDLSKKTENIKNKMKRNISQKNIISKNHLKEEKIDNKNINKEKQSNNKCLNNIRINKKPDINCEDYIKDNNIINDNKIINNNTSIDNFNIFINQDVNMNNNYKTNKSKSINIIENNNNNTNNTNKAINNKNLFYDVNLMNKDEIILRSNAFDANFSGKSILFDKEKTIKLLNEEDKNKNIENSLNEHFILNKNNNIMFNNVYNFNQKSIKMFTLKEEDEDKDTMKSGGNNLYNGDIDNLNFVIQKNTLKTNKDKKTQNDCDNYFLKEENDENVVKVDLDFEIINNSMNNEIEPIKSEKKNKYNYDNKKNKNIDGDNNKKKFELEEYIKSKIGEKIYSIIKEYFTDMKMEQIVNYSYDKLINKLRDILVKKKFREREIKNAEMYLFDIFFIIINK